MFFRFFEVCNTQGGADDEFHMILVFEYIDQDLSKYLEHCPKPGLDQDTIKVRYRRPSQSTLPKSNDENFLKYAACCIPLNIFIYVK